MKIWVIGRGYPTLANKMWGSFELDQAKLLARNGHEVSYIALTLSFLDRQDKRGLRSFTEDKVLVYAYSHFYFPGKAGIYLEGFEDSCWRKLFAQAEKHSGMPDVIHVHYPSMISSTNEIDKYKKQGVRIIVTEHWSRVLIDTLKKFERKRLQYYAENADCFICVSQSLQDAVRQRVKVSVPMKIVPNIVSPMFFSGSSETNTEYFTFITVGRLVPLKQFDKIIEAFLKVFSDDPDVRLRIVGSGSEGANLQKLAESHSQITLLGELSQEKVVKEISAANALVSFSKYETFAAPVAEAWAAGKPAIVSAQSGIASFVNAENGIVVQKDSQGQLCQAMKEIYRNYHSYDPEKISDHAEKHFNDVAVMRQLADIYQECAER